MMTARCPGRGCRRAQTMILIALITLSTPGAARVSRASVILNTLQAPGAAEPGWSGAVDGMFAGSGGNTERIGLELGGRLQLRQGGEQLRLLGSLGYQESNGRETARNAVLHLRHNHDLSERWSSIAFGQVQHNPWQRLQTRWLLGLGVRRDFIESDRGVLAVGVTPMLEIERLSGQQTGTARGRLSTFLHVSRQLSPRSRLEGMAYWQPLLSDPAVSRTVGNLTLIVAVSEKVNLKVGGSVEDNARAAAGVKRTDWSTFTGLGLRF